MSVPKVSKEWISLNELQLSNINLIIITGPNGSGKTQLLEEYCNNIPREDKNDKTVLKMDSHFAPASSFKNEPNSNTWYLNDRIINSVFDMLENYHQDSVSVNQLNFNDPIVDTIFKKLMDNEDYKSETDVNKKLQIAIIINSKELYDKQLIFLFTNFAKACNDRLNQMENVCLKDLNKKFPFPELIKFHKEDKKQDITKEKLISQIIENNDEYKQLLFGYVLSETKQAILKKILIKN